MNFETIMEYDEYIFKLLKKIFSKKLPEKFKNEKLYNSWGRKCNFIINFLKILSRNSSKIQIKEAISLLLDFITKKENNNSLKYLSSFDCEIFDGFKKEKFIFRNMIAGIFFRLIYKYEFEINDCDKFFQNLRDAIKICITEENKLFIGLFELVQFSLSKKADIYKEFLSIMNSIDILKKISQNSYFILDKKQEQYLLGNKFCLNDYKSYIEKLANSKITNEELLKEIQQSNNSINKKKKKNFKNIINQSGNCSDNSNIEKDGKKNFDEKDPNLDEDVVNEVDEADVENNQELNKDSKYLSLSLQIEKLKKQNDNLTKQIEELKKKNEELSKEVENLKMEGLKKESELNNRIDILETKINMICYRDMIKDIINYSFDYFGLENTGYISLGKKVKIIKLCSNDVSLTKKEKNEFSDFIDLSFLTLVNLNSNVHEGGFVSDFSVENFMKFFERYVELFEFDIIKFSSNRLLNANKLFPEVNQIISILNKMEFFYKDEFIED